LIGGTEISGAEVSGSFFGPQPAAPVASTTAQASKAIVRYVVFFYYYTSLLLTFPVSDLPFGLRVS